MATKVLGDALTRVYRTLRDLGDDLTHQLLGNEEMLAYIDQATTRYSGDRPLEVVADVVSDGSSHLNLPEGYEDGFSLIRSIEYPIEDSPLTWLDPRDWAIYQSPAGSDLWLREVIPSGDSARVTFTGRRSFGDEAADTTVPDADFDAVCDLAISNCCDAIAQHFARASSPVLAADRVDYKSKCDEWAGRAKRYEARYRLAIGPSMGSATINWDSSPSFRGDWLAHRRRRR